MKLNWTNAGISLSFRGVVLFVLVNGYFPDVEGMSENSKNVNDEVDSLIFRKNISEGLLNCNVTVFVYWL